MSDLITVKDLKVEFNIHDGVLYAVDGVSFRVRVTGTFLPSRSTSSV